MKPISVWGMIRRPWWSEASGQIWPGHRGNTSTLYENCHGIFNDHRESGPRFNISSEVWCPRHYTGALGPTQTTGWAPPAGFTNTSSNSNLVFPGGLPSRYWPAQPCLASVGDQSWAAGWYGCRLQGICDQKLLMVKWHLHIKRKCVVQCKLNFINVTYIYIKHVMFYCVR